MFGLCEGVPCVGTTEGTQKEGARASGGEVGVWTVWGKRGDV